MQEFVKAIKDLEQLAAKLDADTRFIKALKIEQFIPAIAKVNVSIRNGTYKLKKKIICFMMETELDGLKIRPMISNITTASYKLAKYLAQVLWSSYTSK